MATMTIRLPDGKHEGLAPLAARRGIRVNKVFEERSPIALSPVTSKGTTRGRNG